MKTRLKNDEIVDFKVADSVAYAMENDRHAGQVLAVELAKADKARKTLIEQVVGDFLARDDAWFPGPVAARKVTRDDKVRYTLSPSDVDLLETVNPDHDLGGTRTRTTWKADTGDVAYLRRAVDTFRDAALTPGNDGETVFRLLGCARTTRRALETLELHIEAVREAASQTEADAADVEALARELETTDA